MARMRGVSAREAGPAVQLAHCGTRRQFARLSGRTSERMIEPLEIKRMCPGAARLRRA